MRILEERVITMGREGDADKDEKRRRE